MTVQELREMLTDLPDDADIVLEIRISNIPDHVARYSRHITADPDRITCEDEPDAYYLVGTAAEDML